MIPEHFNIQTPKSGILAAVLLSTVTLSGCFDTSSDSGRSDNGNNSSYAEALSDNFAEVVVDASSHDDFNGINLRTGELTKDLDSDDWHIALQRYNNVLLNGGVKGSGSVEAALAHEQADFYDGDGDPIENVFVNATADAYKADLLYPYVAADLTFESEAFAPAFGQAVNRPASAEDWAVYRTDLPASRPGGKRGGGYVTANEDHYWVVKSTEGDYFVVQFKDNDEPLFDTRDSNAEFTDAGITLAVTSMKADGSFDLSSASTLSADLNDPRGTVYLDLDNITHSTTESSGWDVSYSVESADGGGALGVLRLNGGVVAEEDVALHTDSPFTEADIAALDGTEDGFGYAFESDSVDNAFTQNEWFRYNVSGGHRLSPNYRVFAVELNDDEGDDIVLVQAIRYYHPDSGDSGHVTLRARLLN